MLACVACACSRESNSPGLGSHQLQIYTQRYTGNRYMLCYIHGMYFNTLELNETDARTNTCCCSEFEQTPHHADNACFFYDNGSILPKPAIFLGMNVSWLFDARDDTTKVETLRHYAWMPKPVKRRHGGGQRRQATGQTRPGPVSKPAVFTDRKLAGLS